MKYQQCVIDLAIVLVAVPSLVAVALLLDYTMNQNDWTDEFGTQLIVLGLAAALFVICIMITLYLTHRIGTCMWAGPMHVSELSIFTVQQDFEQACPPPDYDTTLLSPPSYEKLDKYHLIDEPPPSYAASVASLEGAHI
ncbi:uncharacterized protein LOC129719043 [Wyeomyia smithii]|uniref:uncharacterized protein LOC129719043 n=1 Tax=Wyeomyia smithii TaxID=174621 RepID=UPI002467F440|nr:uncharacterized protein LOC129719043 [Wyeomyia smithii]XP_055526370.1 uncharacterized protein LOC129719043 [Wyeomyia smithii]